MHAPPPATFTPASSLGEGRARSPGPGLSCHVGESRSRLAFGRVPPARKRVDPDRPAGRHPVSRSTRSGRIQGPQRAPRGVQAVHPLRLRGRLGGTERPPPSSETKETVLCPVHAEAHAQGREPILLARPRDGTTAAPPRGDGGVPAPPDALPGTPLNPGDPIWASRI